KGRKRVEIGLEGEKLPVYAHERVPAWYAHERVFDMPVDVSGQTVLVAEADEPVPWHAPPDLDYTPDGPLPKIGGLRRSGLLVLAMADASLYHLERRKVKDADLHAAIRPSHPDGSMEWPDYDD